MAIYKNKDIITNIESEKLSINNPDTYFYTEDKGSVALRIFINHRNTAFNLDNTNLTPVLDLFHTDGSIWLDEPLEVIMSDKGLLQYNIPDNVISHAGQIKAKLFLRNTEQSVHVANFTFDIRDSGIEGAIEKEISVNLVDDAVRRIIEANPDSFKGKDADPNDVKDLLIPYTEDRVFEEFGKLSAAKQQDSEVIQARHFSDNLSDEITRIDTKTYTKNSNKIRPLVSFYLDDGYQNDYDIVYPKAKELGIPVTICLFNTSALLSTPERLTELTNEGWEIHSHTATHADMDKLTLEQQKKEIIDNITHFKGLGYDLKGICYPKGYTNPDTLKASREYLQVGLSSIPGINQSPIDTYYVKRDLTDVTDLSVLKAKVDKIKADGKGWLVFYSHSNIFHTNEAVKNRYFEMMEYVKNSGVETVTVDDAMKVYGNTLDIGDMKYSEKYFKVGSDGNIETNNIPVVYNKNIAGVNNKAGTDFDFGKITITSYELGNNSDIPFDSGIGTLYTDRRFEKNEYGTRAFQRFEGWDGTVVTRQYIAGKWTSWLGIGNLNLVKGTYTNDTSITDFPKFKVTKTAHLANENTGFPEPIGVLETNRLSGNDILSYQFFYPYNKNSFYKRYWTSSGWGVWEKINSNVSIKQNYDFGEIEANATRTYSFTVNGVTDNDMPSINFIYGIASNLIPMIYTAGANTVAVKLLNVSNTKITIGTRPILINVTKG